MTGEPAGRPARVPGGIESTLARQLTVAAKWRRRGDHRRAGLLLTRTLVAAEARLGPRAVLVARACNELGVLGTATGSFGRAERHLRRALRILRSVPGADPDLVATVCHNLGGLAYLRGRDVAPHPLRGRQAAPHPRERHGIALAEPFVTGVVPVRATAAG